MNYYDNPRLRDHEMVVSCNGRLAMITDNPRLATRYVDNEHGHLKLFPPMFFLSRPTPPNWVRGVRLELCTGTVQYWRANIRRPTDKIFDRSTT